MAATVIGLTVGIFVGAGCGYFDIPAPLTAIAVFLTGALAVARFCLLRGVLRK
jgi:hypothetical protein